MQCRNARFWQAVRKNHNSGLLPVTSGFLAYLLFDSKPNGLLKLIASCLGAYLLIALVQTLFDISSFLLGKMKISNKA